jgi:hypothetical protein
VPGFDDFWTTAVASIKGDNISTVDMLEEIVPWSNRVLLTVIVSVSVIVVTAVLMMTRHRI